MARREHHADAFRNLLVFANAHELSVVGCRWFLKRGHDASLGKEPKVSRMVPVFVGKKNDANVSRLYSVRLERGEKGSGVAFNILFALQAFIVKARIYQNCPVAPNERNR